MCQAVCQPGCTIPCLSGLPEPGKSVFDRPRVLPVQHKFDFAHLVVDSNVRTRFNVGPLSLLVGVDDAGKTKVYDGDSAGRQINLWSGCGGAEQGDQDSLSIVSDQHMAILGIAVEDAAIVEFLIGGDDGFFLLLF